MEPDKLTMSAQTIVMTTPEILDLILAALPIRHLLTTAQLVSYLWHTTITTSPTIQQKLFFRPIPETTKRLPKYQLNPLLQEAFPPWFEPHRFPKSYTAPVDKVFDDLPISLHREVFLRKGASWRKMLVQQPPALEMGIMDIFNTSESTTILQNWTYFTPHPPHNTISASTQGLRMGTLYDLVQNWLGTSRHFCQVMWRILPSSSELLENEVRDVTKNMLVKVDVVVQRQMIGEAEMQDPRLNSEWRQRFRCVEYEVVDISNERRNGVGS